MPPVTMPPRSRPAADPPAAARPAPSDAWRTLAWMGMRWQVPRDWEILSHGVDPLRGRLLLVDRRRQRMQLSWAKLDSRPDLEQAIADHRSRDMAEDAEVDLGELRRPHDWVGYTRRAGRGALSRFTRYEPALQYWIDLVVSHPVRHEPALDEGLTASFEALDPQQPPHWRAFGLEVRTPMGWRLKKAEVNVADVTLRFAETDGPAEAAVRRLGMIDAWFLGDVQQWLRHTIGVMIDTEFTTVRHGGVSACLARGLEPGTRWRRLTGRLRLRRDLAWVCEPARSLVCVSTWSRQSRPVEPDAFEVDAWPML